MKNLLKNHDEHEEKAMHRGPSPYYESYIKLSKNRVIFICEDFTKELSSSVCALLMHYDAENSEEDITIFINSRGGDAAALIGIYDTIRMISAPVKTVCIVKCYSAGAFLLCAGTKGKRYVMANSEVMIHRIQCAFPLPNQTQVDHQSYFKFLELINEKILKMTAEATGHTVEKIRQDFNDTRHIFLDAKEAIAYGLADHIL